MEKKKATKQYVCEIVAFVKKAVCESWPCGSGNFSELENLKPFFPPIYRYVSLQYKCVQCFDKII